MSNCQIIPDAGDNVIEIINSTTELSLNAPVIFVGDLDEVVDDRVSELLIAGSGISIEYNDNINILTIAATGLSNIYHEHTSDNIIDFDSSVSGLLPVIGIASGSNIQVSSISGVYTISHNNIGDIIVPYSNLSNSNDENINVSKRLAKAWVNFNGTGTISIRNDFNVSSITDNGVGDYTINFSTPFTNTSYAFIAWARDFNADTYVTSILGAKSTTSKTNTSLRLIMNYLLNGLNYDSTECNVIVFGE
jgi:hypothetical protein